MEEPTKTESNSWHLDKKVPISLIAAILIQSAVFGGWLARQDSRVGYTEDQIAEMKIAIEARRNSYDELKTAMTRLEEQMKYQTDLLRRLEVLLDQRTK